MGKIARIKNDGTLMIKGEVIECIEPALLFFDGVDDYVEIPNSADPLSMVGKDEFTLQAWKYYDNALITDTDYRDNIVSKDHYYAGTQQGEYVFTGGIHAGRSNAETILIYVSLNLGNSNNGGWIVTGNFRLDVPTFPRWLHHTAQYKKEGTTHTINLYVHDSDGVLVYQTTGVKDDSLWGGISANSYNVNIANSPLSNICSIGELKEIRIWEKLLTLAEIESDLLTKLNGNELGLKAYWSVDEGKGNILTDYTGNGFNGVIHGAEWMVSNNIARLSSDGNLIVNGEFKQGTNVEKYLSFDAFGMKVFAIEEKATLECLYFDGISQALTIANTNNRLQPNNQFTWEMWFKLDGYTQYNTLMAFSGNNFDFGRMDSTTLFKCHAYDSNSVQTFIQPRGFSNIDDGQWHHMAIVWDGVNGERWGFIDGIERFYATMSIGSQPRDLSSQATFTIGGATPNSRLIKGWIKEVRMWQKARTQAEILSTMDTKLVGNEDGLFVYLPLDEGKGSTLIDKASGFEANINGANW